MCCYYPQAVLLVCFLLVLSSGVIGLHGSGWVVFVTQRRAYLWRQSPDQGPVSSSTNLS